MADMGAEVLVLLVHSETEHDFSVSVWGSRMAGKSNTVAVLTGLELDMQCMDLQKFVAGLNCAELDEVNPLKTLLHYDVELPDSE